MRLPLLPVSNRACPAGRATTLAPQKILAAFGAVAMLGAPIGVTGQQLTLPDSLPPGVTPAMVNRGKAVFQGDGLCHTCHGADATGEFGPNLTDAEWWHAKGSYLSIVQQVLQGVPAAQSALGIAMPPKGGSSIGDADVQAVAAYVWKLSHDEAGDSLPTGVTPAMVRRGSQVFAGEGECTRCHGPNATGALGPSLTDDEWLHAKGDYLAIVNRVFAGVAADKSRSGKVMPPRGGSYISEVDVYAVAAYVWVLSRLKH